MILIPPRLRNYPHMREWNWLVHARMIDFLESVAPRYATGDMADIGCGLKPYKALFAPYLDRHIGIDHEGSPHDASEVDVFGTAYETGMPDCSCDTVLFTEVLEHLEEPQHALTELLRILKPGGHLILTVPFFWQIHEPPRDFYRFSEYGLRYQCEKSGFEVIRIEPLTGAIAMFAQLGIYAMDLRNRPNRIVSTIGRYTDYLIQRSALKLDRPTKSARFTNLYGLVARKCPAASGEIFAAGSASSNPTHSASSYRSRDVGTGLRGT